MAATPSAAGVAIALTLQTVNAPTANTAALVPVASLLRRFLWCIRLASTHCLADKAGSAGDVLDRRVTIAATVARVLARQSA